MNTYEKQGGGAPAIHTELIASIQFDRRSSAQAVSPTRLN